MDLKWLEDLQAVAQTGSLARAAAQRHVTHPAFGRRLQALEAWAGVPLLDRSARPVRLTAAGQRLAEQGGLALQGLTDIRAELRDGADRDRRVVLAAGRTIARTLVADWLAGTKCTPAASRVVVRTGSLADTLAWLEQGQVDLLFVYHHRSMTHRPAGRHLVQKTLARDRLVPVNRPHAPGRARRGVSADAPTRYLAYASTLALGQLVADHLARHSAPPALQTVLEADSADALLEYTLKGMGLCWLPWSLAATACRDGRLVAPWDTTLEIPFEVRLVRMRRRLGAAVEALWQATPDL